MSVPHRTRGVDARVKPVSTAVVDSRWHATGKRYRPGVGPSRDSGTSARGGRLRLRAGH